jgi:hypothetical protein
MLMRRLQSWAKRQSELLADHIARDQQNEKFVPATVRASDTSNDEKGFMSGGDRGSEHVLESREPLLAADHLSAHLANHSRSHAESEKPGPLPAKVQFNFNNTLDNDGGGDIYVTADLPPAAGTNGRSRRVLFAPGADLSAVKRTDDDDQLGNAQSDDVVVGGDDRRPDEGSGSTAAAHSRDRIAAIAAALAMQSEWKGLTCRERMRFINGWTVLALVADVCNIASSSLNLQTRLGSVPTDVGHALAMGSGLVCLWLGVLRYLEHNR